MYSTDLLHPNCKLQDKLEYLYKLNRVKKIDMGFRDPFIRLLEECGNPHLSLPPTIHIAGTNGKGSTLAFLKAILNEGGYSTHIYTSPHLVKFNERIVIADRQIKDDYLEQLIDKAIKLNENREVTFFEITTVIAFMAFAENKADFCLLETGMGGRLDCTNVIKNPLACLISSISEDHKEFLGESLQEIAHEKAGIIKENTNVICGYQSDTAKTSGVPKIFEKKANEKHSKILLAEKDWFCESSSNKEQIEFRIYQNNHTYPLPSLEGKHQIENAGLAITCIHTLSNKYKNFTINHNHICKGLQNASWHARLQKIILPFDRFPQSKNWTIYLDGGHNESAGKAIANTVSELQKSNQTQKEGKTYVIAGMLKKKESKDFFEHINQIASEIYILPIPNMNNLSWDSEEINKITNINTLPLAGENLKSQIRTFFEKHGEEKNSTLIICGSLYLAGAVIRDILYSNH